MSDIVISVITILLYKCRRLFTTNLKIIYCYNCVLVRMPVTTRVGRTYDLTAPTVTALNQDTVYKPNTQCTKSTNISRDRFKSHVHTTQMQTRSELALLAHSL